MSYIGNQPVYQAFVTDQFSGNGSTTAFTMSVAPANTASVLVAVSGVLQDPSTYSVSGTTLTFSAAPPSGTGNISARYLGIPASGVTTTAYRTVTEFTATAGQTTFTVPSYTAGYINVYRNGALLGTADYTATNGTTVVLATGATSGDLVAVESFYVSSVLNAIPATNGAVTTPYILDGAVTAAKMASNGAWAPTGTVLQVVNGTLTTQASTTSSSYVSSGLTASITPKFSTSKILIVATFNTYESGAGLSSYYSLFRGVTNLQTSEGAFRLETPSAYVLAAGAISYYDSPATTSSTSYTVYMKSQSASCTTYLSYGNAPSSITLMEIAG